jgi:hypothetical protein
MPQFHVGYPLYRHVRVYKGCGACSDMHKCDSMHAGSAAGNCGNACNVASIRIKQKQKLQNFGTAASQAMHLNARVVPPVGEAAKHCV